MEAEESEYSAVLKTRNLLIFRDAQNVENGKIAPNWNVSGTRDFQPACHISISGNYVILLSGLGPLPPNFSDGQSGINLITSCLPTSRTEPAQGDMLFTDSIRFGHFPVMTATQLQCPSQIPNTNRCSPVAWPA